MIYYFVKVKQNKTKKVSNTLGTEPNKALHHHKSQLIGLRCYKVSALQINKILIIVRDHNLGFALHSNDLLKRKHSVLMEV